MRALHHPAIGDITVEGILHALSDPVRMDIFMSLAVAEYPKNCSAFLNINKAPLAKSTLSQHFKVLREAGLVYSERCGVELHNKTRCAEIKARFGDILDAIISAYGTQMNNCV